jgi:sigma-B regulation protein RsbU (phosphoserine phosphatase)
VGTLIVDERTVVTFANPAAVQMLGVPRDALVGEAFGLPLSTGEVTDVNVPGEDQTVRTLALRATELPGGNARLVTLFDVSGRARLYEHEHRLVESLQRSLLLERMPAVDGVALAARYVPGEGEVRVGGDWYDAIPLPDGRLGLAIGDVVGHGVASAALMSQLRNTLRAYALEHPSPAAVLDRLDRLLQHLEPGGMATIVYLSYEPGSRELTFAAAGHPYPLLARPDGGVEFLEGGRSLPLGAGSIHGRAEAAVVVDRGSSLILYTDGLVERRTQRSLDEGLERLAASVVGRLPAPDAACELILSDLLGDEPPTDDVALLVMRSET